MQERQPASSSANATNRLMPTCSGLSGLKNTRPKAPATAPVPMTTCVTRRGATNTATPVSMPTVARPKP